MGHTIQETNSNGFDR